MTKYFLKSDWQTEATQVSKEEYVRAEQSAGFRSKFGPNEVATGSFSNGVISGYVEYGELTGS